MECLDSNPSALKFLVPVVMEWMFLTVMHEGVLLRFACLEPRF